MYREPAYQPKFGCRRPQNCHQKQRRSNGNPRIQRRELCELFNVTRGDLTGDGQIDEERRHEVADPRWRATRTRHGGLLFLACVYCHKKPPDAGLSDNAPRLFKVKFVNVNLFRK